MGKTKNSKQIKKQNLPNVKVESLQKSRIIDSAILSENLYGDQIQEKKLDQKKIIKEFLLKRKLLMKALKQKQKQKNPKLLTLETFQNNEGYSKTHSNHCDSQNLSQNEEYSHQFFQSNNSSLLQNHIKIQEGEKNGSKIEIGIQTNIPKKKTVKKSNRNKQKENNVFDCLIQDQGNQGDINKQTFYASLKKSRNNKDLEKIKNQIISQFSNKNAQQFPTSSKQIGFNKLNILEMQKCEQSYQKISDIMKEINDQIQDYYYCKPLKEIIIQQFQSKFNQRLRKNSKGIQRTSDDINNKKSKVIKKHKNYESLFFQTEELEKKIFKKRKYLSKKSMKKKSQRRKNSPRKIINDRFKNILNQNCNNKNRKNKSSKKDLEINFIEQDEKDLFDQQFQDLSEKETGFDLMMAWQGEFQSIQQVLFEKYDYLRDYVTEKKKINYRQIYKNINNRRKSISSKIFSQNKSMDSSSDKSNSNSSYFNIKEKLGDKYLQKFTKGIKKDKKLSKKVRTFKQLPIKKYEEDQFGKSFELNQPHQTNNQCDSAFDDLNKSNIFSNVFNSSFHSQSHYKRSETCSQEKMKKLNLSFFSQSKSSTKQLFQQKSFQNSYSDKSIKKNEWSFFKGQQGKQIFYMSEQIVFESNPKK